jgi:cyclopropane fatty-acyl-phospholipid synthase-like methyltransferase
VLDLAACPVCSATERTLVSPYNGLILLASYSHDDVARYAYALCHGCGLVYATRRPVGAAFVELLESFDDNLGRIDRPNLGVVEGSLSDTEKDAVRARMRAGWLISEEAQLSDDAWWPMLRQDRLSTAQDLTLLASSLDLKGARVLDVRSNAGALLDSLRNWFGADVFAMPFFEADQLVIQEHLGIPAERLIDYDQFRIPYEGEFDVILAKHMITHAVRLDGFFAEVKAHLKPGGHLYLYVENDDVAMWSNHKNLLGELKCFHFQNFDLPGLARILRMQGFEPEWILHVNRSSMSCLARLDPAARTEPISPAALETRRELYRRWYDLSVLSLPSEVPRDAFAAELAEIGDRAVARGDATGAGAEARPKKRLKLTHEGGYVELNRRMVDDAVVAPERNGGLATSRLRAAASRMRAALSGRG